MRLLLHGTRPRFPSDATGPGTRRSGATRARASTPRTALLRALAMVASAFVAAACGGTRSELEALPAAERAALLARTLETLRTTCPQAPGVRIEAHCRELAELARSFPECDEACEALAARYRAQPTR